MFCHSSFNTSSPFQLLPFSSCAFLHNVHSAFSLWPYFTSCCDVASLTALPFSWAARGRLAGGLGDFLTRLHPLLAFPEETRVTPFPLSHLTHMAGCFLLHSCGVKSFCSLRNPHFRHRRIHMTDRTRYHHPSSSTSACVSVAKCTWGMKKMSSPAAFSNATLSQPPSVLGPSCNLRIPATLLEVARLRTSLTFSTKLSPNLCMLTLVTSVSWSHGRMVS
jgi:hypothetical protein